MGGVGVFPAIDDFVTGGVDVVVTYLEAVVEIGVGYDFLGFIGDSVVVGVAEECYGSCSWLGKVLLG